MAKPQPLEHPVLGMLVPDKWGDYMTFREFPYMKPFWFPNRDDALKNLSAKNRERVENWREHMAELTRVCRDFDVLAALQSLGVYEISIANPEEDEEDVPTLPTDAQVAAFQYFTENEERICGNVIEAMRRYYLAARTNMADWFDEDDDYPDDPTVEQLGEVISFDGFSLTQSTSNGMAALRFGWDPQWDPEHGLISAVYKDQTLAIGNDDVDCFLEYPEDEDGFSVWGANQMNEAEQAMRQEFIDGFEPGDDDEDY